MLLTVQELAQLLQIKAATLYAWAARGCQRSPEIPPGAIT